MSWVQNLQPNLILGGTILTLTPKIIEHYSLKGLVLDVDETLVPIRSQKTPQTLINWVNEIKEVAQLFLVSNNISQTRISAIAESLDLPYILGARKPSRRKLRQATHQMSLPYHEVAMVGDRLFTDVLAGNRLGMFTILVEPMVDPAMATRKYPVRNAEVWISQALGVSLAVTQHKFK